jgi:flagellar biosynthesis protein FliR
MVVPGLSSGRIPTRVRLYFALALSFAITTLVETEIRSAIDAEGYAALPKLVVSEAATGLAFGLLIRILFSSMQMAGVVAAATLGIAAPVSTPVDDGEAVPPPTDLVQIAALTVFFLADLHHEVIAALIQSYAAMPVAGGFSSELWLDKAANVLADASRLAVRLVAPLLVISLMINIALGIAGRMLPMLPVQFLGAPLVLAVGLAALGATAQDLVGIFVAELSRWLVKG